MHGLPNLKITAHMVTYIHCFFHIRTVHLDIIKVTFSPTNAKVIVLKTVLKFTLQ